MKQRLLCLSIAIFIPAWLFCAEPEEPVAVTLDEAVRLALTRHPDVGKARASADVLQGRIREVRAQALPDISINSGARRSRDPGLLNAAGIPEEFKKALAPVPANLMNYSIDIKQPLYTAGKVGTALRLASIESEGSEAEIDRAEQDLSMAVVRAFFDLLWAEQYRDLVAETQRQKELHAEMARTRFQNGAATEVDVLRSEVTVANGAPDLLRAENAIRQARALLNYYLVRPIDYPTKPIGEFQEQPWLGEGLEALTNEGLRRRPEVHRLRVAESSAQAALELAKAESRMTVDLTGSYGVTSRLPENLFNSQFLSWNVGLNFKLPVFDGHRRSGLVYQATANARAARLERERVEQQVKLSVQQSWDEMHASRETISAARANVGQAEKVRAMMQDNYKYGAATTLDVVDAQTSVLEARTNLLRGLHDYSVAQANLRWVAGMTPWE